MHKLTVAKVKNALPGKYGDGGGLYLKVKPSGARSWILRVQHNQRTEEIGLGGFPLVTLAEAREKALEMRRLAKSGENARAHRNKATTRIPTFKEALLSTHAEKEKGWSDKQAASFLSTLTEYAVPKIGGIAVSNIGSADIVSALKPIWTTKPQMARKVRGRIMQVLAYSRANGWRTDPLPHPSEITEGLAKQPAGKHFAAMPYAEVPEFVAGQLRAMDDASGATASRLALLFTVFTAARSGEVRNAQWAQIDRQAGTWKRSAEFMKAGKEHTVMLNKAALAILDKAQVLANGDGFIFPSARRGRPLSDQSMSAVMRRAGSAVTVHGFRSSFKDWSMEKVTSMPWFVSEVALAHVVGNEVQRAYARSELQEMRAELAEAWGRFTAPSLSIDGDNVVPLHPNVAAVS